MIWIHRILKVVAVASDTGRRRAHVLAAGRSRMTILAAQRRMDAQERKPRILMLLDHICHAPRLRRMAAHAVGPQLSLMHVGMASAAQRIRATEHQALMTA